MRIRLVKDKSPELVQYLHSWGMASDEIKVIRDKHQQYLLHSSFFLSTVLTFFLCSIEFLFSSTLLTFPIARSYWKYSYIIFKQWKIKSFCLSWLTCFMISAQNPNCTITIIHFVSLGKYIFFFKNLNQVFNITPWNVAYPLWFLSYQSSGF